MIDITGLREDKRPQSSTIVHALLDRLEAAEKERDELRTKIEQMEKQEPVARVHIHRTGWNAGVAWSVRPINDFDSLPLLRDGDKLYARPGAQGEEK